MKQKKRNLSKKCNTYRVIYSVIAIISIVCCLLFGGVPILDLLHLVLFFLAMVQRKNAQTEDDREQYKEMMIECVVLILFGVAVSILHQIF